MGGGVFKTVDDHILVVCPFPKIASEDILNRVSYQHPGVRITYMQLAFGDNAVEETYVSEGRIVSIPSKLQSVLFKATTR